MRALVREGHPTLASCERPRLSFFLAHRETEIDVASIPLGSIRKWVSL
jgi:hypothetical protein